VAATNAIATVAVVLATIVVAGPLVVILGHAVMECLAITCGVVDILVPGALAVKEFVKVRLAECTFDGERDQLRQ
jgi:hypothetical protein